MIRNGLQQLLWSVVFTSDTVDTSCEMLWFSASPPPCSSVNQVSVSLLQRKAHWGRQFYLYEGFQHKYKVVLVLLDFMWFNTKLWVHYSSPVAFITAKKIQKSPGVALYLFVIAICQVGNFCPTSKTWEKREKEKPKRPKSRKREKTCTSHQEKTSYFLQNNQSDKEKKKTWFPFIPLSYLSVWELSWLAQEVEITAHTNVVVIAEADNMSFVVLYGFFGLDISAGTQHSWKKTALNCTNFTGVMNMLFTCIYFVTGKLIEFA